MTATWLRWLVMFVAAACTPPAAVPPAPAPEPAPTMATARALERGTTGRRDFARAAEIYATLCADGRGALDACFALADAIIEASGTAFDPARLVRLDDALCRRGDPVACVTKLMLELQTGGRPENALADELKAQADNVATACEHDDGRACEWLASMRGGDGSSAEWDRRRKSGTACAHGRIAACSRVAYEFEMCGEPEVDDAAACEARLLATWRSQDFDADRVAAITALVDACRAGDPRACAHVPSQRIPLQELCAAHDYAACGALGCIGDDAAEAQARANGVDQPNCYVAVKTALVEWRRARPGPHRPRFEPIVAERRGPIGARPTKPFEAVRFAHHGGRDRHDWPRFDVYNLNDRAVTELAVCLYAYAFPASDPPQQLGRVAVAVPHIAIAANAIVPLVLDGAIARELPAGTADVIVDYDHVRFEGDAAASDDPSRCPAERPYDRDRAPTRW